jgi:uncharacterized protein (TIRG00374 family)
VDAGLPSRQSAAHLIVKSLGTPLRQTLAALTSLPGRLIVTAGLLALVAAGVDWSAVRETVSDADWPWFALALGLTLIALAVGAVRWHGLLEAAEVPVTLRKSVRAYAVGAFSNNVLPTGFGGDVVRAWIVGRSSRTLARSLTSVAVDRVSALGCLLVLAWAGALVDPQSIPTPLVALLAVASGALLVAGLLAMVLLGRRSLGSILPERLRSSAAEVAAVLRAYRRDREVQLRALGLGIVFQALIVGSVWALGEGLRLDLGPAVIAVVTPLVLIATLVPISIAGFGVREGAFVVLLGEVGVATGDATLLSLMTVATLTLASLPGGVALALGGERLEPPPNALGDDGPAEPGRASHQSG